MLGSPRMVVTTLATQSLIPGTIGRHWMKSPPHLSSQDESGRVQLEGFGPTRNRKVEGSNPSSGSKTPGQRVCPALLAGWVTTGGHSLAGSRRRRRACPASLRRSPSGRFIARRWASFVGPLRAKLEDGRLGRPCGPGALRAFKKNQLAAASPFSHSPAQFSHSPASRGMGLGGWRGDGGSGPTLRPTVVGRLVAVPWRLPWDPVPSSRDAGEPAAAGHQGLVGPCRGACIALDGEPDRALGRQPGGLSDHKPLTTGDPAGRLTGCCTGVAGGGPAAGSAGTSGAAGHVGCRGCWRVSVASGSTAARPCSYRVAFLVHSTRSSGAAPPPAGLTAVRAWWMTGAG
jgi:hypothetical protein